jgi:cysteine desulfurase / selenocysteine lyase
VRKQALAGLSLGLSGWTNHEDPFGFLVRGPGELRYDRPLARSVRFAEPGTLNAVGIAALGASLELLLGLGIESIFTHVNNYLDHLEPELVAIGCESVRARSPEGRSAILSVRLPPGKLLSEVAGKLATAGVVASTPDGYLRFAPHFPNELAEIPHVASALRAALV